MAGGAGPIQGLAGDGGANADPSPAGGPGDFPAWMAIALIAGLGLLAYANTFAGEFVWDDVSSIVLHEDVKDPARFGDLFTHDQHRYGRGEGGFYRPLLSVSFMLDYRLARLGGLTNGAPDPFVFHVTSAAWHILAAGLFFALAARFGTPLPAALVYVVHPIHTEAVAYISGRADSMAAAGMFAALYFGAWDGSRRRRVAGTIGCAAASAFAMLCKESAMILPALAFLCAFGRPGGAGSRYVRFVPVAVSVLVLGAYVALRRYALPPSGGSSAPDTSFLERTIEAMQSLAIYARLIAAPAHLHMERTLSGVPAWAAWAGAGLLLAGIAAAVWAIRNGRPRAAIGLAWFVVAWLPISGLFPLNAPLAEHWMYVPLAGLLWALAEFAWPFLGRPPARGLATAALFLSCAVLLSITVGRNRDWRSNESLYAATLRESPGSIRVRYGLAVTYENLVDNPIGATREFETVNRLYDEIQSKSPLEGEPYLAYLETRLSLAKLALKSGRYQQAADHFGAVLQARRSEATMPHIIEAALGMGRMYLIGGNDALARTQFEFVKTYRPDLAFDLALLLMGAVRPDDL